MTRDWVVAVSLGLALSLLSGPGVRAEGGELDRLRRENDALRERVRQLEEAVAEIRRHLGRPPAADAAPPPAEPVVSAPALAPADPAPPPVKVYGYVKLDAARDTGRSNPGNFARWVDPSGQRGADPQFNLSANDTRVGIDVRGPTVAGARTSAKVEVDFYGGGPENRPQPMMRHASFQLDWPGHDLSLMFGQGWDVFSPLFPTMINYSPGWWAGNIGYRHPMVKVTKGFAVGPAHRLQVELAAARTIGDVTPFSPGDTGADNPWPSWQGRLSATLPGPAEAPLAFGVSGHYGRDERDLDPTGRHLHIPSWSLNLDLSVPLGRGVNLKGEAWRGANLDSFLGGVGQGTDLNRGIAIRSAGGWVALGLGPWRGWQANTGWTLDDPVDRDLPLGGRARNEAVYGNLIRRFTPATQWGVELSHWQTRYRDLPTARSTRIQTSLVFRF